MKRKVKNKYQVACVRSHFSSNFKKCLEIMIWKFLSVSENVRLKPFLIFWE